jgi:hypothetical protein
MALIAVGCDKGSPGATTTALALAAAWPRPVLLAETDPSGGCLIYRLHTGGRLLDPRTGLDSLAATTAAAEALTAALICARTQRADALAVLLGPANEDQGAILAPLWPRLGPALARHTDRVGTPIDVIADLGRLSHTSPALELLPYAARTVLVTRTGTENLAHLRDRALNLAAWRAARTLPPATPAVVLITSRTDAERAAANVHQLFARAGLPVHLPGALPVDPAGAAAVGATRRGGTDLERAAAGLAARLLTPLPRPRPTAAARPQPTGGIR